MSTKWTYAGYEYVITFKDGNTENEAIAATPVDPKARRAAELATGALKDYQTFRIWVDKK